MHHRAAEVRLHRDPQPGEVDVEGLGNTGRLTMGMNITGVPAISVPAGLSPRGMPIGMQIVGPRHSDALLLSVAALFEKERPWPLVAPSARTGRA